MRVAVNITHPAHFHFFRNAITQWQANGDDVMILSRKKDLTLDLLDASGWQHRCLSRARHGLAGLAWELFEHGSGVWRALRRHRSQIVMAIGGTFMVHAAKLRGIPSLIFYDTENAKMSNRISYPFATRIFTPRSYRDEIGTNQQRYDGYQELAYLHPKRFKPDAGKLAIEGIEPDEPFTFVRLVAWASHHDVGDYGVRDPVEVVERLRQHGQVVISSEAPLPDELKQYELKGSTSDVHHILAFARLTFGESATMASEGAQLGVPGVFLSTSSRGYTDELEQRYQMVFNFNGDQANQDKALQRAEEILANDPQTYRQRHQEMMAEQIDVTEFIMQVVQEHALER